MKNNMELNTSHKEVNHAQEEMSCREVWYRHQQAEFVRDIKTSIYSFLLITYTNFSESPFIFGSEGTLYTVGQTAKPNKNSTCFLTYRKYF